MSAWDGVGPKGLAAIDQHRVRGTALLEIFKTQQTKEAYAGLTAMGRGEAKLAVDLAAEEFRSIIRAAPNLAFGYGNLAVAYLEMNTPPHPQEALQAAQEARSGCLTIRTFY